MDQDNNKTSMDTYDKNYHKYKVQRWHSWFWLVYFSMYNLIQFIMLIKCKGMENFENKLLVYGIFIPLLTIFCFAHSNIIITLFTGRLKPLLVIKFPKFFADQVWNQVYTKMFHPTTILFTWITMITSVIYPIYFAIQFAKWWTWLIYIVVLLLNLMLLLFTAYNLYGFGKLGKDIYNKYEGEKK